MAKYLSVHPDNPQHRAIMQAADIVREGGVIAYPTDSCYALGCQLGNKDGMARIRSIRGLDDRPVLRVVRVDAQVLGHYRGRKSSSRAFTLSGASSCIQ